MALHITQAWCWDSFCEGSLIVVACGGRDWDEPVFGFMQLDIFGNALFETTLEVMQGRQEMPFLFLLQDPTLCSF